MVIIKSHCISNENKYISYNIEYPQFESNIEGLDIEFINKSIYDEVYSFIDVLEQEARENREYIFVFIDNQINLNNKNIVSISIKFMYTNGNKYLTEYIKTYNHDFNNKKFITLDNLFKRQYNYKTIINKCIKDNIEGFFLDIEDEQSFYINEKNINLCFSAFELHENNSGITEIQISFKLIGGYLNKYAKNYIIGGQLNERIYGV